MDDTNSVVVVEEERKGPGRPKGSVKVRDTGSFLRQGKHEFDDIIKKTKKEVEDVMSRLADIVQSENATNSEKIKAGDIYLANYTKMVEQRNKDEITRRIAEIRVNNGAGSGSTADDEEDDNSPLLEFDDIPAEFQNTKTPSQEEVLEQSKKES
jgi:hypothetical protein